jgi:hypothetical protein
MSGQELKEAGIAVVNASNEPWKNRIIDLIEQCVKVGTITSCQVRKVAQAQGIGNPSHPNAWGAVFNAAARKGIIKKTGQYVKSRFEKSHSAVVAVWEKA